LWIEPAVRVRRRKDRAKLAADEPRVFREETGFRRPANHRFGFSGQRVRGTPLMVLQSLTGLPAFLVYFCTAIIAVVAYLFVYTRVTPHDEFKLIRDNDPAAAIALGLSLLGFVLPLVSAITVRPPRQVGKWCVRSK
jgi:hypothetical protein